MKRLKFLFFAFLLLSTVVQCRSQEHKPVGSVVMGIFVASTPCSQNTRPLPGIDANTACEWIKWKLTIFQDEFKKTPAGYRLHCVYGLPKQGSTDFVSGGNKLDMEGEWTIGKGIDGDPAAIVYQLEDDKTHKKVSLLKLSDNLLQVLDSTQRLMIGNAAWSYTLNKIDHN